MLTNETKRAIAGQLDHFKAIDMDMYSTMKGLATGNIALTEENIKNLGAMLAAAGRNINEAQSILSRFRDIEKQIRALEQYGSKGEGDSE